MINGLNGPSKLGKVLYDSKFYVHYNFGWDHHYEFMNMYDYNLYGDPSMIREGISSSAPIAPHIDGPSSGKAGEEHEYIFVATDLNKNDVSYYIEWGDETVEDWIGPYPSGDEANVNHTWIEQGEYTIKAKAKDTGGLESDWSTLSVSMPRNKPFTDRQFLKFLAQYPILYQLLQQVLRL